VLNAARLQLMMMHDLLAFSELQDGDVKPVVSLCNAAAVAQDAVAAAREAAAARRSIITTDLDRSLEVVRTDAKRLGQCLAQLLSNAVKFTENGEIEVSGQRVRDMSGDWIELKVRDTGIGIPRAQFARVFEPFAQGDESATRTRDGTGLGLAIVSRYAAILGGGVCVESEVGRGSTFTLRVRADLSETAEPGKLAAVS
jgi:signal transduction histidine kinase